MTDRKKLAAGNWKMNGTSMTLSQLDALAAAHPAPTCDILICPPVSLLSRASEHLNGTAIMTGGQTCHANKTGAHTGEISADMLRDAGAQYVILGHSERRTDQGETNADVRAKSDAALAAELQAIVCVGETLAEREAGTTLDVIATQLAGSVPTGATATNLVIAYEPVWAIGTGKVPTLEQIGEVHDFIRGYLAQALGDGDAVRILYGGSVKGTNAKDIFAVSNVDGALVGGASLKTEDFSPIILALESSA